MLRQLTSFGDDRFKLLQCINTPGDARGGADTLRFNELIIPGALASGPNSSGRLGRYCAGTPAPAQEHVNFYLRHADAVASTNRYVSSIEDAKRVYAFLAQGMRL